PRPRGQGGEKVGTPPGARGDGVAPRPLDANGRVAGVVGPAASGRSHRGALTSRGRPSGIISSGRGTARGRPESGSMLPQPRPTPSPGRFVPVPSFVSPGPASDSGGFAGRPCVRPRPPRGQVQPPATDTTTRSSIPRPGSRPPVGIAGDPARTLSGLAPASPA